MSDLPPPPPSSPGFPPPPPPAGSTEKAGPGIRLVARIIDGVILVVPAILVGAIVGGGSFAMGQASGRAFIAGVITTAIGLGYYAWFESNRGQTPGKMAMGLRVHGPSGGNPTFEEALKRNLFQALGIVPILGGIAELVIAIVIATSISSDPRGQGPHDRFAGGTVVTRDR